MRATTTPFNAIAHAPMARFVVPFALGIAMAMVRPLAPLHGIVALAVVTASLGLVLLLPTLRLSRWQRGIALATWCFIFGACWQSLRDSAVDPLHLSRDADTEGPWAVRITALNGASEKLLRSDAEVVGRWSEGAWKPRKGSAMVALLRGEDGATVKPGDLLLVNAPMLPIDRVPDPGGFDRRAWAAARGIHWELFAPRTEWTRAGHLSAWTDAFDATRDRIAGWLEESGMPLRQRALVKALVLGLRDELDGEQKDAFVRSGTVHVLAVSGTHVGFIYAILLFMSGWWGGGRKARWARGALVLLALWGYAGLTGACPSVLRATIMFSLFTVAGMFDQRSDGVNNLFAAGLLLLLWDPHMLMEIGFQLSFLAVLGILLFYAPLESSWQPRNWLLRRAWSLCAVSIAAQVLTTPLSLFLFKAFPIWFLPANLVVVTAAGFAVYGAVALLLLYKVPFIGAALTWAMTQLVAAVDRATVFFAELPGAYPAVRIGLPEMLLLYVLVGAIGGLLLWHWRSMRWVAGGALCLLLLCGIIRSEQDRGRDVFTVYDDRHTLQASMVHGNELVLLCHPDSFAAGPWIQAKAERHQRFAGLDAPQFLAPEQLAAANLQRTGSTLAGGGYWSSLAWRVAFVSGTSPFPSDSIRHHFDALVLHDVSYLDDGELDHMLAATDRVVLAAPLRWSVRNTVRDRCRALGIACHDVRDQGAFILER